jgi:LacI family transcriptional regulator
MRFIGAHLSAFTRKNGLVKKGDLIGREDGAQIRAREIEDGPLLRLAIEHLLSLGHTRIAHLAGPLDYSTGLDRYESFHETMRAAGHEPEPELVLVAEAFTESEGARRTACR